MKKLIIVLLLMLPFLQGCTAIGTAVSGYAIYQMIESMK